MPLYRFIVRGLDPATVNERRGFYTTRHAFAPTEKAAADRVLSRLRREFTVGASAHIWRSGPPELTIEESRRIALVELFSAPNRGSTFYDERE